LLEAFAVIPNASAGANVDLAFVGPDVGGMKTRLARTATQLGVQSRVHFCGPIFGDAKWAVYRDADVFVLPSQNENFGNAAAEAAASGTPVVITEQCGIAPLLANIAGLVVPHEAAAISRAISRVLTERDLHVKLSAGGRQVASQLGWDEPALRMEQLYTEIVSEKTRAA
jgi:glycosyltransferase involved in cell wall biosynthesis